MKCNFITKQIQTHCLWTSIFFPPKLFPFVFMNRFEQSFLHCWLWQFFTHFSYVQDWWIQYHIHSCDKMNSCWVCCNVLVVQTFLFCILAVNARYYSLSTTVGVRGDVSVKFCVEKEGWKLSNFSKEGEQYWRWYHSGVKRQRKK